MNTLRQKALAWEAFQAAATARRTDGDYFAALSRRFPKEAAIEKLETDKELHQEFDAWWKTYRAQQVAKRRAAVRMSP